LEATGVLFDAAIAAAVKERAFCRECRSEAVLAGYIERLRDAFGLDPDDTVATIEDQMIAGGPQPPDWRALALALSAGKPTDCKRADALNKASAAGPGERLDLYLDVFFTDAGTPRAA